MLALGISAPFIRRVAYAFLFGFFLGLFASALSPYFTLMLPSQGTVLINGKALGGDFSSFYLAGKTASEDVGRLYDWGYGFLQRKELLNDPEGKLGWAPFAYPPFLLAFFQPLSRLPFHAAYYCWVVLSLVMALASILIVLRLQPNVSIPEKLLFCIGLLAFAPFSVDNLSSGQTAAIGMLIYAFVYWCLKGDRELLAGLALGFGIYKPPLFVVFGMFMVLQGRVRMILGTLTSALCLLIFSNLVWPGSVPDWLHASLQYRFGGSVSEGLSLPAHEGVGLLSIFMRNMAEVPHQAWICYGITALFLILEAFILEKWLRSDRAQVTSDLLFALNLSLSLFLSVQMLKHDASIIAVALAVAASSIWKSSGLQTKAVIAVAAAFLFVQPKLETVELFSVVVKPLSIALMFWCMSLFSALFQLNREVFREEL